MNSKNWRCNMIEHRDKSKKCISLRRRLSYWSALPRSKNPHRTNIPAPPLTPTNLSRLRCLGLWRPQYKLKTGNHYYQISLLPPLGNTNLYYISRRSVKTTMGVVHFAVHHRDCLGLAHNGKFEPLKERTCAECQSLFQSDKFIKILTGSNDPSRMKLGTKVNSRYLSHTHLCSLKTQQRILHQKNRLVQFNQMRRMLRLEQRAATAVSKLNKSKQTLDFIKHVDIIEKFGTPEMKSQALQFVYRFAAAISAKARVHAGQIKRTCIKDWGPILPIFTALRTMSLSRVERLFVASLGGCGPPPTTVKDSFRKLREKNKPCCGFDVEGRMRRAVPILRCALDQLSLPKGENYCFSLLVTRPQYHASRSMMRPWTLSRMFVVQ